MIKHHARLCAPAPASGSHETRYKKALSILSDVVPALVIRHIQVFSRCSEPERDAGVHGRVPDLARVIQRRHNLALAVVMGTHMESIIVDTEVRLWQYPDIHKQGCGWEIPNTVECALVHNAALAVVTGAHMESMVVDTEVRLWSRVQWSEPRPSTQDDERLDLADCSHWDAYACAQDGSGSGHGCPLMGSVIVHTKMRPWSRISDNDVAQKSDL